KKLKQAVDSPILTITLPATNSIGATFQVCLAVGARNHPHKRSTIYPHFSGVASPPSIASYCLRQNTASGQAFRPLDCRFPKGVSQCSCKYRYTPRPDLAFQVLPYVLRTDDLLNVGTNLVVYAIHPLQTRNELLPVVSDDEVVAHHMEEEFVFSAR